ncbi:MAG: NUDIX hydrolase [Patescibacteria group bacterium]
MKDNNYPTSTFEWEGKQINVIWIRTDSLEEFSPITQVYGICFNDKDEILICRRNKEDGWQIPGGHPEKGETIEETLKRELLEEVDVKSKKIKILGVQKVYPKDELEKFSYQLRCVCEVDKLLPQTPDPDNGDTWERKFIPAQEAVNYIKWGLTGDIMFKDAISLWKSI